MDRPRHAARMNGAEFVSPLSSLRFMSSGCTTLDCVVGGGWPLGRMWNIVGDKSTGKTLLAIEACANFARRYRGQIWYRESESAFNKEYAGALGMPLERISFIDRDREQFDTVEQFHDDLVDCCRAAKKRGHGGLYILDSLDALSDEAEKKRKIGDSSFGANKAKKMSELFRRLTREIEGADVSLGIISQVRANINATFGRKTSRTGGKAMDFYASQVLYLAHIETIYKTKKEVKRATGIRVRAKCDKNKVGLPFRECEFTIQFGYGIDDLVASLDWMLENKKLSYMGGVSEREARQVITASAALDKAEYGEYLEKANEALRLAWVETEQSFLPKRKKYADASS